MIIDYEPSKLKAEEIKIWKYDGVLVQSIDDQPALISDGVKYWFKNGFQHRDNGPAVEGCVHNKYYWMLYGITYSFEEWLELTQLTIEEKVLLKLRYV